MPDIVWKPLPVGLWPPGAVFAEVGQLTLEVFIEDGVPTWEITKHFELDTEGMPISKGTADSFEAAKAAAIYEARTA